MRSPLMTFAERTGRAVTALHQIESRLSHGALTAAQVAQLREYVKAVLARDAATVQAALETTAPGRECLVGRGVSDLGEGALS